MQGPLQPEFPVKDLWQPRVYSVPEESTAQGSGEGAAFQLRTRGCYDQMMGSYFCTTLCGFTKHLTSVVVCEVSHSRMCLCKWFPGGSAVWGGCGKALLEKGGY